MQELDIETIRREAEELAQGERHVVILEAEMTNDTPFYGGEASPTTVAIINGKPVYTLPRPASIVGVWRWWARLMIMDVAGVRTHSEADRLIYRIDSGRCTRTLFGKTRGKATASRIELIVDKIGVDKNPLYIDYDALKKMLRRILAPPSLKPYRCNTADPEKIGKDVAKDMRNKIKNVAGPLSVLNGIPRLRLLYQGLSDHLNEEITELCGKGKRLITPSELIDLVAGFYYVRQPIKPRKLGISLSLIDRCAQGTRESRVFAASTFLLAMVLGGIGGLTSRGFGKLCPTELSGLEGLGDKRLAEAQGILRGCLEADAEELEHGISLLVEAARDSAAKLLEIRAAESRIIRIKAKNQLKLRLYPGTRHPELRVLRHIGVWTTKNKWKSSRNQGGAAFHTWVLGLPREVKGKGYMVFKKNNGRDRGKYSPRRRSFIEFRPVVRGSNASLIMYSTKIYGVDDGEFLDILRHICRDHELVHVSQRRRKSVCELLEKKQAKLPGGRDIFFRGIRERPVETLDRLIDATFDALYEVI